LAGCVKTSEIVGRQRDPAEHPIAVIVAMEIGPPGDQQTVIGRKIRQPAPEFGRVIRVMRLEGVEPRVDKRREHGWLRCNPGVRHRRNTAAVVNGREHGERRRPDARNERRPAGRKVSIECFLNRRDVTAGQQRLGERRASNRTALITRRRRDKRLDVDRDIQPCQPFPDFPNAFDTPSSLRAKKVAERAIGCIDEITEDVHVLPIVGGGDLYAVDDANPDSLGSTSRFRQSGNRIVIGHAEDCDPAVGRAADEVGGAKPPVRGQGMKVEVNHGQLRPQGRSGVCRR
jgi:hypothetical protein